MNKQQVDAHLQINPFQSVKHMVCDIILQEIIAVNLKPGEKLNISKISEDLDVSRTPVREALLILCEEGFVTKNSEHGFSVSEINFAEISQIHFARTLLESKAAFLCASQKNCPNITEMRKRAAREFTHQDSYSLISSDDDEFHSLIVLSCGNKYLMDYYDQLKNRIKFLKKIVMLNLIKNNQMEDFQNIANSHKAVIHSIRLNMPQFAEKEMENHINKSFNFLISFINSKL